MSACNRKRAANKPSWTYTRTAATPLYLPLRHTGEPRLETRIPILIQGGLPTDALPTSVPGGIYKFKLTSPTRSGEQPSGNTWIRFSRNVPPYFANSPDRLIYPIVHREFDPVLYTSKSGAPPNRQTYRAYLTVPRGQAGTPLDGKLKVNVNNTVSYATAPNYIASISVAASPTRKSISGDNVQAQLLDINDNLLADSTDRVDNVYFVPAPDYGDDWPDMMLVAYDNGNGNAVNSPILKAAHFNVIQTDIETTLSIIDDDDTKAFGALYSKTGTIRDWFNEPTGNHPNDSRVLFWGLKDEPDSGPGAEFVPGGQIVTPVTSLKDLYDGLYDYKGKTSAKPCSLNIMHPIFLEEFSKGCDIISSDPFVKDNTGTNQKRITDCAAEMKRLAGDTKKTLVILWWWAPDHPISTAINKCIFAASFDTADDADVNGIGGFNFSGSEGKLNQDTDLWDKITEKNDSV